MSPPAPWRKSGRKTCFECKEEKALNAFYSDKEGRPGSRCRKCLVQGRVVPRGSWRLGEKKCTVCLETKSLSEYSLNPKRDNAPTPRCRRCNVMARWHSRYGVSQIEYMAMLKRQEGRCAICRSDNPARSRAKNFSVDHCHKTGRIRGLLCYRCNPALGFFKDNEKIIQGALDYLRVLP